LYSITYNECTTQYRKDRRRRRLFDALSLNPLDEEVEPELLDNKDNDLDRWLVNVNTIDREIIILRFVAELEFQEIASIVNLGLSATKIDRKSTRLNSSHVSISYAVFCLKKKNKI